MLPEKQKSIEWDAIGLREVRTAVFLVFHIRPILSSKCVADRKERGVGFLLN